MMNIIKAIEKLFEPKHKSNDLQCWHKWFAWYPVRMDLRKTIIISTNGRVKNPINSSNSKIVWLRTIARCMSRNHTGYGEITNPYFSNLNW